MGIKIVNWTYTRSATTVPRDAVRMLVGDTNPDDKQLDDDEIAWLLADNGGPLNAAIAAAAGLAAMYSRRFDSYKADDTGKREGTSNQESLAKHYLAVYDKLMTQRARRGVAAFAGGLSISQKLATDADADRVRPFFRRRMGDYFADMDDLRTYYWGGLY